ncbi:putative transcriptional regulator, Lys-family [Corynebacterium glutamicum MB001]|uniref:Probable hydrogen peroxide-inducible genes activator n=1 Tax=Corynebacterium glutamicum (strain ATCC 13032 / DSM 20300 / JCM 1318 / BCRC 11384 / CCUG 27702 / LMG 3730 / NBRC 12168 / NCIMB 10025 / NRRL B-2784 / 534) TaxID=196627 RepID=Q8NP91_CORGL|nr:hydrogen peroxide-inducible genes activator [Corynebacterium glutamicum]AGT05665.1 putative transcriptional regulator, Lys-family [Corynebacterium glutamicum MB001]ARV64013.1 transcriptional regulator [Corynebacterium glutamicum]ASW14315.1 putative transcriptional regulator, Lys-family [Corynebacterium glutamicum]AUI05046.1 hydrogen peroxide-inducible genes activator [Corynebacterium glutamicum]MBA4571065.1 LysR family transcriptional regulator [Corynebacterium glutamicum]
MSNKEYRPTLAQLRTFVTIAECKHFGTAATKLSISQPSLSQALVALETGLGVQLIERSTRKVIVTPAGEKLLPFAKSTLDAAESFLSHAKGANGSLTGPLTVGIIPTAAPYILPSMLSIVDEEYPDLEPHIVEDQTKHLLALLRDGAIDVAMMALPSEAPGMKEIPLYDEDFIVVTASDHPFAGRQDLELSALEDLDLLLLDDGHCLHDQIVDLCRRGDINPISSTTAVTRASSLTTVMQLVVAGLGSTLVPISAIPWECTRPGLATANFNSDVTANRRIGLVYRSSSSRAEEFEQFALILQRAFQEAVALAASTGITLKQNVAVAQ